MYARVEDEKVIAVGSLSMLLPNLSIPQTVNEKDFAKEHNLESVVIPDFDDFQEKLVVCEPYIKDGKVYAHCVETMSDDEKIANVNAHVDFELISTAWVESDPDMDKNSLNEWKEYRKKIKSLKSHTDVSEINWPERPAVELQKIMEEDPIA